MFFFSFFHVQSKLRNSPYDSMIHVYLHSCIITWHVFHITLYTGSIFGDPHFVTFDMYNYTFNGRGEFTLVETEDLLLNIQGRFTEALDPSGRPVAATVLSAISIRDEDSDIVQFEISRRGIDTLVNGEVIPFEVNVFEIILKNATLNKEDNDAFSVRFDSGLVVTVQKELEYISLTIISLPESYIGQTRGLFGNFNGNVSDELVPNGFPIPFPTTSSLRTIHEGFGLTCMFSLV